MASAIKLLSQGSGKLLRAYGSGKVQYPRVAYDYKTNFLFHESPHPSLNIFDVYSEPLAQETYPLFKKTLMLELANNSISTPATAMRNAKTIDIFFDDKLQPIASKRKELIQKIDNYYTHLGLLEKHLNSSSFSDSIKSGDVDVNTFCHDGKMSIFEPRLTVFAFTIEPTTKREEKRRESKRKKIRDHSSNVKSDGEISVKNFQEAVDLYRKKRVFERRTREKKTHRASLS